MIDLIKNSQDMATDSYPSEILVYNNSYERSHWSLVQLGGEPNMYYEF